MTFFPIRSFFLPVISLPLCVCGQATVLSLQGISYHPPTHIRSHSDRSHDLGDFWIRRASTPLHSFHFPTLLAEQITTFQASQIPSSLPKRHGIAVPCLGTASLSLGSPPFLQISSPRGRRTAGMRVLPARPRPRRRRHIDTGPPSVSCFFFASHPSLSAVLRTLCCITPLLSFFIAPPAD
jgi:hypothetical protein